MILFDEISAQEPGEENITFMHCYAKPEKKPFQNYSNFYNIKNYVKSYLHFVMFY